MAVGSTSEEPLLPLEDTRERSGAPIVFDCVHMCTQAMFILHAPESSINGYMINFRGKKAC